MAAAATETGLLTQLEHALPTTSPPPPSACLPLTSSSAVRRRLLLTVLFLGVVGLQRTWDLRGYTADGLALLTGRKQAYGYRYTEAFLSQVARSDGAERFTDVLACWATQLWHPTEDPGEAEQPHLLTCYVDGHRKTVYSEVLIPRGLIGRMPRHPGLPRAPVAARRTGPSLVCDHPSWRPASHRGRSRISGAV